MVMHEFLWGHMVSFCLGVYPRVELLVFSISGVRVVSLLIHDKEELSPSGKGPKVKEPS